MARVKRGGKGVRRAARASKRASRASQARRRTSGAIDAAMGIFPFTEEQWQRIFLALIVAAIAALVWFLASLAGAGAVIQGELAHLAHRAGFEVRHVRLSGIERMNEQRVYERALAARDMPMPRVDVEALRERLLELPWVEDARVSRQLPDVLAIDIVERKPHAVLQKPDRLVLIDARGHELEPIARERIGKRLVILGPGAARQVEALDRLLDAAPALKARVRKAEWVGNRRWNLTFDTGQLLALPEGEEEAASALIKFARLDGQNQLLGGKVQYFDMRAPPRLYMRVPGGPLSSDRSLANSSQETP